MSVLEGRDWLRTALRQPAKKETGPIGLVARLENLFVTFSVVLLASWLTTDWHQWCEQAQRSNCKQDDREIGIRETEMLS